MKCTNLTEFYINTHQVDMQYVLNDLKNKDLGKRTIYFYVPSKCRRSLTTSRQLTSPGGTVLTRRLRPSGTVHRLRYDFLGIFHAPIIILRYSYAGI